MEEFVAYIVKNLVSVPEEVKVSSRDEGEYLRIEMRVAQEDVGKIIGRKGNTINALRAIVRTVATRLGRRVQVELLQDDKPRKVVAEEAEPEAVSTEETAAKEDVVAEETAAPQEEAVAEEATV
ncbi:MAG: hypothetical protein S4CHLAM45_05890 [Chlamydiales bacterium]|nr:hypothetical protein [Chlamydiales bacterium]MCH9619870.1 hypothetical protein [Chlamydiales bacterium]MCH9622703.1 hypothetical protein [Chlamydiales bacterium]